MIDIATLSKQTGIAAHTLRYYESRGLIASVGRSGLKRVYAQEVVLRLKLIRLGQQVGMSLDGINQAFHLSSEIRIERTAFQQQAAVLAVQIRHLQTMQALLQHLADCSYDSHLQCPSFQALLQDGLQDSNPD